LSAMSSMSNDVPGSSTEFRIGVRSVPYLADHGFQDMVVLPGSFYIETALSMDCERSKRVPGLLRNVRFHNPIILSPEDTVLNVEVRDRGEGRIEFAFYEATAEHGSPRPPRQVAAQLEIDRYPSTSPGGGTDAFSIEAFQAQSHAVIDSEQFYKRLRESGNQYGPRFQNVSSIWRAGDQSLGRLSVAREHRESGPHCLHPSLLDSVTQLLAPFTMEKGKTFILRSIEKVEVRDVNFPDTLWAHATLLSEDDGDAKGILGNVRVFDQSGKPYLELSGVALTLLDRADAADEKATANLVIASNFTAEPL
jgi:acyl transferase domain-containing protein